MILTLMLNLGNARCDSHQSPFRKPVASLLVTLRPWLLPHLEDENATRDCGTRVTMRKAKRYAQGDLVLERVEDQPRTGKLVARDPDGAVVLARGEVTGHR